MTSRPTRTAASSCRTPGTNTIWVLDNGNFSIWLADPKLKSPNGLLVEGDKLIVAGFGTLPDDKQKGAAASLVQVSLADKSIRSLGDATPVGNLDGPRARW